ncbi:MAG: MMPL family transporter [Ilumatobacter sp.]|nr:MMPL family transporter [Ilumatobacter sp.]
MLRWLIRLASAHHRRVLIGALVLLPVLAVIGGGVEEQLSVGGFVVDDSESARGEEILEDTFDAGSADWVAILSFRDGTVRSDEITAAGLAFTEEVGADPGVTEALSFWTLGEFNITEVSPLQSVDGKHAVVAASLAGDEDEQRETAVRLEQLLDEGGSELWTASATGPAEISRQAREGAEEDLLRSELIAAPLTLIALLLVFRGIRPAALPLAVAIFTVLGTFTALSIIARLTTVSVFALNLTTALGLGLSIDYCLLMVARFREELAKGRSVDGALSHTVQTAGRTVLYSGATVATSLLALLVFPVAYLRSFAYAGVAVVLVACAASVVILPALLAWIGERIGVRELDAEQSFWGRQARRVIRHPTWWATAVALVLVVVGLPFLGLDAGRIDDRVLPEGNSARVATDQLRDDFAFRNFNGIGVIASDADPTDEAGLREFTDEILALDSVIRVDTPLGAFYQNDNAGRPRAFNERFSAGADDGVWVQVISARDPDDPRTEQLVRDLRELDTEYGGDLIVTGAVAAVVDAVDAVESRLPSALVIIAIVTLVVLFMMTGSVVVPLKAVVLNLLSLTATFGALVWIFQDGNFSGFLDFTATGRVDVFTPILMFCIAFGLSMDYEVFLLSRIKEEYDLTGDNDHAIVAGIGSTGRIVTAAAVLLAIVFLSIATSGVTVVKMFGVGLTIAVMVDAFLVRATLTPALMKLAGRANWWAPAPLRRFHLRWGLWENEPVSLPEPEPQPATAGQD